MTDKNMNMAVKIAEAVAARGGTAYFVGGFVRDKLMKRENKDIDIEVHGIAPAVLESVLDGLGERISIGESFGIYNLKGYSLDISMPRKEENRGKGHVNFEDCVDPFIGTRSAAMRRDLTINALLENVLTGEVVDHFGGAADLERGIIRHVSDATFVEDPLRVLRACQFAARFCFSVADETIELCKKIDLSALARERVMGELEKALLKSDKPSVFFETLRKMNGLSVWFPELERTIGVKQNPKYHAEGDVWTHTMMVADVAVRFRDRAANPLGFMLSAVTHDFGKAICTEIINGVIHSYDHERLGLPLVRAFLQRLTTEKDLIKYVLNLSELHMKPNTLAAAGAKIKSTNKLFDSAVDPEGLVFLAVSDGLGKIAAHEYVSYDDFFAERLAIFKEYMSRPFVMGKDLVESGLMPSEKFTEYLAFAHKLRLAGIEKGSALRQTVIYAEKAGERRNIFIVAGDMMAKLMKERCPEAKVIPFREDLSKGSYEGACFDSAFIAGRASFWGVSESEYIKKMSPIIDLDLSEGYILTFGSDDTCVANLRFMLDYLKNKGYNRRVCVRIVDELDLTLQKEYFVDL